MPEIKLRLKSAESFHLASYNFTFLPTLVKKLMIAYLQFDLKVSLSQDLLKLVQQCRSALYFQLLQEVILRKHYVVL